MFLKQFQQMIHMLREGKYDKYHVKRSGTKISVPLPIETLIGGKSIKHLPCAQGTLNNTFQFQILQRRRTTNRYLLKNGN